MSIKMKCNHESNYITLRDEKVVRTLGISNENLFFNAYIDTELHYTIVRQCSCCKNYEVVEKGYRLLKHEYITPISIIKNVYNTLFNFN